MEGIRPDYFYVCTFSHRFQFETTQGDTSLRIFDVFQTAVFELKDCGCTKEELERDPFSTLAKLKDRISANYSFDLFLPAPNKETCLTALKNVCYLSSAQENLSLKNAISSIEKDCMGDAIKALTNTYVTKYDIFCALVIMYVVEEDLNGAISMIEKARKIDPTACYRHLLSYVPTYWEGYNKLALLMRSDSEHAHVLIKGALEAIKVGEFEKARQFCQKAHEKYPGSFMDRWVDVLLAKEEKKPNILTNGEIQKILLSLLKSYPIPSNSKSLIQFYRMLLHLNYSSQICQKVIMWYLSQGCSKEAFMWLKVLEEEQDSSKSGKAADSGVLLQIKGAKDAPEISPDLFMLVPEDAPLDLWNCLVAVYVRNGQLEDAKKCCKKAHEKFRSFEIAIQLADIFFESEQIHESVESYYKAIGLAGLEIPKVAQCVDAIKRIDPNMDNLSSEQKSQMSLHKQRVDLHREVKALQGSQVVQSASSSIFLEMPEFPPICTISPKSWNIGEEIPPDPAMGSWLKETCPFFGRKREEIRHRIFIPEGLTLERLLQFAKSKNVHITLPKDLKVVPIEASYWMTITAMNIPNTIGLTIEDQEVRLQKERFPTVLECLSLCILGEQREVEYTRCAETVGQHSVFVKADAQGITVTPLSISMGTRAAHRF